MSILRAIDTTIAVCAALVWLVAACVVVINLSAPALITGVALTITGGLAVKRLAAGRQQITA